MLQTAQAKEPERQPEGTGPSPYRSGELAARAGRGLAHCPFGVNDVNRVDWMLGYHQARDTASGQTPMDAVVPADLPIGERARGARS